MSCFILSEGLKLGQPFIREGQCAAMTQWREAPWDKGPPNIFKFLSLLTETILFNIVTHLKNAKWCTFLFPLWIRVKHEFQSNSKVTEKINLCVDAIFLKANETRIKSRKQYCHSQVGWQEGQSVRNTGAVSAICWASTMAVAELPTKDRLKPQPHSTAPFKCQQCQAWQHLPRPDKKIAKQVSSICKGKGWKCN